MKSIIEPKVLKGFRDILPPQEIERKRIQGILENEFEQAGFVPIDTPILEYTNVLLGKGSGETDKQIYRFFDHGKRDVAMRFDLTVPFARFMAGNRKDLYIPFKRYHLAKVWRGENTQRGRYREFAQCDFDIVGVDSASADFEILHIIYRSFQALQIHDFTIHFSNRAIFNRFLQILNAEKVAADILRIVDKLFKVGRAKVLQYLQEVTTKVNSEKILEFIEPESDNQKTLDKLVQLVDGPDEDTNRVESIYSYAQELGMASKLKLNPAITRGLDYYTGIVCETFLNKLPEIGSVCSGGRYNNLASLYTKELLPGMGASIGLDRLLAALAELHKDKKLPQSKTQVLILCLDERFIGFYHKLADTLRDHKIFCEVYPLVKKFSVQFRFAENKGIPLAVICGEDEKKQGTITFKNLVTRESMENIPLAQLVEKTKSLLDVKV